MAESTNNVSLKKIIKIVGEKGPLLKELVDFIHKNYSIKEEFKYSKKSGWTIYYRKSGKSLTYIEIKEGGFKVVVVIGVSLSEKVTSSSIRPKVKDMFNTAKQFYDGKWLFFEVQDMEDINDIKSLLLLKMKPNKILCKKS